MRFKFFMLIKKNAEGRIRTDERTNRLDFLYHLFISTQYLESSAFDQAWLPPHVEKYFLREYKSHYKLKIRKS